MYTHLQLIGERTCFLFFSFSNYRYDKDGNANINKEELGQLVEDPLIPGSMSVMLRIYARTSASSVFKL